MNLKLKYRRSAGLLWVGYYGLKTVYINKNRKHWKGERYVPEKVAAILSHEAIHLALNKFDLVASAKIDILFGDPGYDNWQNFPHGLGDLDEVWRIFHLMRKQYAENMNIHVK